MTSGTATVVLLLLVAAATTGCATAAVIPESELLSGSDAGASAASDATAAATAIPSATPGSHLVSPEAAPVCEGPALEYARSIGADAALYSGGVATDSELGAWEAERLGGPKPAVIPSTRLNTLCFYTDVPTSPPQSPSLDGVDVSYSVLGVKVDASGVVSTYSMAPTGSESGDLPTHTG
jgi:hypothetical protein